MTVTVNSLLTTLTNGLEAAAAAIVSSVASFSATELLKLTLEGVQQIRASLDHFLGNLKKGYTWGAATASLLTEVWNDVRSDLQQLATDFVEAVAKVFQGVKLLPATA